MKPAYIESYDGFKINSCKARNHGVYPALLRRILDQVRALQSHYARITIVRIDLHFPAEKSLDHKLENLSLSRYLRLIKMDLGSTSWKCHKKFIHGWVKENGKTGRSHFHLFIGIQSLQRVLGAISSKGNTGLWGLLEKRWKQLTGGSIQFCGYHVLNRGDNCALSQCFYHLSYLAKTRDKHFNTGESYRRFSFSSLPIKRKESEAPELLYQGSA